MREDVVHRYLVAGGDQLVAEQATARLEADHRRGDPGDRASAQFVGEDRPVEVDGDTVGDQVRAAREQRLELPEHESG